MKISDLTEICKTEKWSKVSVCTEDGFCRDSESESWLKIIVLEKIRWEIALHKQMLFLIFEQHWALKWKLLVESL